MKAEKSPHAQEVVDLIGQLYDVEAKIRGKPPLVRSAVRQQESTPILAAIKARLEEILPYHPEKSDMVKSINYVLKRWAGLTLFVEDGRIELDNNPVERQFKPTILLRNNVLFIGSEEGGEAWAISASLAQTCKLNGVDFHRYLMWVFEEVTTKGDSLDFASLLPWNAPLNCRRDSPRAT